MPVSRIVFCILLCLWGGPAMGGFINFSIILFNKNFDEGVALYKAGNYRQALPHFMACDSISIASFTDNDPLSNYPKMWLASCYYKLGDTGKAKETEPQSYRLPPVDFRLVTKSDSIGHAAIKSYMAGDFSKAIALFKEGGEIEKRVLGPEHWYYASTSGNIGICYSLQNDSVNALRYFIQKRELLERAYPMQREARLEVLSQIGWEYLNHTFKDGTDKARACFSEMERISREERNSVVLGPAKLGLVYCDYKDISDGRLDNGEVGRRLAEDRRLITEVLTCDTLNVDFNSARDMAASIYFMSARYDCDNEKMPEKAPGYINTAIENLKKYAGYEQETLDVFQILKVRILNAIGKWQEGIGLGEKTLADISPRLTERLKAELPALVLNLADMYYKAGLYDNCIRLAENYIANLEINIDDFSNMLVQVVLCFCDKGDYDSAQRWFDKLQGGLDKQGQRELYARVLLSKAQVDGYGDRNEKGRVAWAKDAMSFSSHTSVRIWGLFHVADAYWRMKDATCLEYQEKYLKVLAGSIGEQSPEYRDGVNTLGQMYFVFGDYQKAVDVMERSRTLDKTYGNPLSADYLLHELNGYRVSYYATRDDRFWIPMCEKLGRVLGRDNLMEDTIHNTRQDWPLRNRMNYIVDALEFVVDGLCDMAEPLWHRLSSDHNAKLQIDSMSIGKNQFVKMIESIRSNMDTPVGRQYQLKSFEPRLLSMSGRLHMAFREDESALTDVRRAVVTEGGKDRLFQKTFRALLVNLCFRTRKYEEMKYNIDWCYDYDKKQLLNVFQNSTREQRTNYWNLNQVYFSGIVSIAAESKMRELYPMAYNVSLLSKGLLLNTDISIRNIVLNSGDASLIADYNRLVALQDKQTVSGDSLYNDSIAYLRRQVEYSLLKESRKYGDWVKSMSITQEDVRRQLKSDDIAIEFFNYTDIDGREQYVALILEKGKKIPSLVPLCTGTQLDSIAPRDYYTTGKLADLVWKPLMPYLQGKRTVYFSPAGKLYNIAVEYVPLEDGTIPDTRFRLFRLSSTRELALNRERTVKKAAAVYGGLEYDTDAATLERQVKDGFTDGSPKSRTLDYILDGSNVRGGVTALEGTLVEAEHVAEELNGEGYRSELYAGAKGTEETVKALSGRGINILHIATHGFYWTEKEARRFGDLGFMQSGDGQPQEDQALTRSGLLFAGANTVLRREPLPDNVEDGVLTARELSQLDFQGLELVVLSACQTGLGEITGDGVFGLQRGFKKAGVHTLVMSLWKVDDRATQLLMTAFYRYLGKGLEKREAFAAARTDLRNYENGRYDKPMYWAAFIMLDGLN